MQTPHGSARRHVRRSSQNPKIRVRFRELSERGIIPNPKIPKSGIHYCTRRMRREVRVPGSESEHKREKKEGGGPLSRLSRSYLVRGTDEVPNPKSEVRFVALCENSHSRLKIQNPQIRSPRCTQRESKVSRISESPNTKSDTGPERSGREPSILNPQIPRPAAPLREKSSLKFLNPKSDSALGVERAMSETERVPVMSLFKSYRTRLLNPTG